MAFYQTEDLAGMPYCQGDCTLWSRPFWFPTDGTGVLVLEDVNRVGDPHVINCLMGLLLDRRLHAYCLPAGWRVAATLNVGQEFLATRFDPAQISRMALLDLETDVETVVSWGAAHGCHPLVVEFLRANPAYLLQLPAADGQTPWANPRSWLQGVGENLPRDLPQNCQPAFLQALVSTFVGEAAAVAFVKWLDTAPPSCKDLLERPLSRQAGFRLAADSALLMQRLVEFVTYLPKVGFRTHLFENLTQFLSVVPKDAMAGFVRALERQHQDLVWTQRIKKWIRQKKL
jgi:hypothetical protein